jgi:hypothetical protein
MEPKPPNGSAFNFASDGFVHAAVTSASALPVGLPLLATDPNAKTPYSEQWHATIEQQIPYSTVLKVAYVGTSGVHLDDLVDINAGSPGTTHVTTARPYSALLADQPTADQTRSPTTTLCKSRPSVAHMDWAF